jgi:F420-non-reducing hydrogenase iron-sulfur subunit
MEGNTSEVEDTKSDTEVEKMNDACTACSAEVHDINDAIESTVTLNENKGQEKISGGSYEPRLLAFCCNWCSYAGADLAGVSRLQYPPNIRIIRVMCSGRIEPQFVLRALELGADGVLVAGCHPGDCHYISGNMKAEARMKMLNKLLEIMGVDTRRVRLEWISASEGPKFANTIKEFVAELKELGPNPLTNNDGE